MFETSRNSHFGDSLLELIVASLADARDGPVPTNPLHNIPP